MSQLASDWVHREFEQNIEYNILQVATLLNNFDSQARFKLAALNEKLDKIERQVEHIEASIRPITENKQHQ